MKKTDIQNVPTWTNPITQDEWLLLLGQRISLMDENIFLRVLMEELKLGISGVGSTAGRRQQTWPEKQRGQENKRAQDRITEVPLAI